MKKIFLLFFLVSGPVFASPNTPPEKKIQQAVQKEEAGDYKAAEGLYQEVLTDYPDYEPALLGLAEVLYWEGKYEASLKNYLKLLEKNPNHFDGLIGISKVYLAFGNQKKAEEYLAKAEKIDPENKELKGLSPQLERKTRTRIHGGYITQNLSYGADAQSEFQSVEVTKEKTYGLGLRTTYTKKFNLNGFDTNIFGHYYFKEKTRVDLGVGFAPKVNILPQQSYTVGLAHTVWKVTPEIHYTFQDYAQANLHFIKPAVYTEPVSFLRVGGGYEYHLLTFGGTNQTRHSGFARAEVSASEWLSLNAFYKRTSQGFEGGRAPNAFVNYKAHVAGGGIGLDFMASTSIHFDAYTEKRNNGEDVASYTLAIGYVF